MSPALKDVIIGALAAYGAVWVVLTVVLAIREGRRRRRGDDSSVRELLPDAQGRRMFLVHIAGGVRLDYIYYEYGHEDYRNVGSGEAAVRSAREAIARYKYEKLYERAVGRAETDRRNN